MAIKTWKIHPKYLDDDEIYSLFKQLYSLKKKIDEEIYDFDLDDLFGIFKNNSNPEMAFKAYLYQIYLEIIKRGIHLNANKIDSVIIVEKIPVIYDDLKKEFLEYLEILKEINMGKYISINNEVEVLPNPVFNIVL